MKDVKPVTGPLGESLVWWPFGHGAIFVCPNGHDGWLAPGNHTVTEDGYVYPSVVCPYDGCEFHEMVRLLDWAVPADTTEAK